MDFQISETEYQESLNWLFSQLPMFSRVGAPAYKPGLDTTLKLDEIFGHPHLKFKAIHVGGTNGKGSSSHLIASVLQAQGYKTGLYTSPHLTDFRERMRINGEMIPKRNVVEFVNKWRDLNTDLKPSFFELTMMMAFDWFAAEKVDFAVIEVGMGGRLDSTNIISPILSVITNISFDHTQFLGDTLPKIASEKAGIIKPGISVVIGEAEGEVKRVFQERAEEVGAPVIFAEDFKGIKAMNLQPDGWECTLSNGMKVSVPLGGEYQKWNIRTVLCAVEELKRIGVEIDAANIRKGMEDVVASTGLRGRWQTVRKEPIVICDTGHNMAGLQETTSALADRFAGRKVRFVLGFVNDKDVSHIVDLFPKDGIYYFTQASIPRAMPVDQVFAIFGERGIGGHVYRDVRSAYEAALADSDPDDVIYIGGSTFIVADFLKE